MTNEVETRERSNPAAFSIETVSSIASAFIVFFLIIVFIARPVRVDGSSMNPTLTDTDWLVVRTGYYVPEHGDIVIISREQQNESPLVKRVIAVGGDSVDIDFAAGAVIVNGEKLEEPYIAELTHRPGNMQFPLIVPEDFVFVMGDNRNHSLDSRFTEVGLIERERLLGKAVFRLFPWGSFSIYDYE